MKSTAETAHMRRVLTIVVAFAVLAFSGCTGRTGSSGALGDVSDSSRAADVSDSAADADEDTSRLDTGRLDTGRLDSDQSDTDSRDVVEAGDATDTEAQPWPYETGTSYLSESGFIEYIAGDAPVVIAAPHGGYLEPDDIDDRSGVTVRDAYTQELARQVSTAYFEQTGQHAHVVITLLARTKVDTNRDIDEAAQGDPQAEQAWREFHGFIDDAKQRADSQFGEALYLDLHGHGHAEQRIELGYLLSKSDLRQSDAQLDTAEYIDKSSIRALYLANADELEFSELLRGPQSMGSLLEDGGFPSVPSASQPAPESSWSYFRGGYNTRRHGSREGGSISSIQLEINQDARFDEQNRADLAVALAEAIDAYWSMYSTP